MAEAKVFTPEQFGAAGDGITDDTDAVVRACNAAIAEEGRVQLSEGKTYRMYGSVKEDSDGTGIRG